MQRKTINSLEGIIEMRPDDLENYEIVFDLAAASISDEDLNSRIKAIQAGLYHNNPAMQKKTFAKKTIEAFWFAAEFISFLPFSPFILGSVLFECATLDYQSKKRMKLWFEELRGYAIEAYNACNQTPAHPYR